MLLDPLADRLVVGGGLCIGHGRNSILQGRDSNDRRRWQVPSAVLRPRSSVSSRCRNDSPLTGNLPFTGSYRSSAVRDSLRPGAADIVGGGNMRHPLLLRAAIGAAGLAGCLGLLSTAARGADLGTSPVAPNLFGTIALPVHAERFYADWERARRDASTLPEMQRLIAPARGLSPDRQVAFVQAAVTRQIQWMSSATLWGQHIYWASAAETLHKGAGDMINAPSSRSGASRARHPDRDLYMTIGRDMVGGPITVLLVRLGSRVYVLDDTGGAPYATEHRPEFEPMLTFGYGAFWIHGHAIAQKFRRRRPPPPAGSAAGSRK